MRLWVCMQICYPPLVVSLLPSFFLCSFVPFPSSHWSLSQSLTPLVRFCNPTSWLPYIIPGPLSSLLLLSLTPPRGIKADRKTEGLCLASFLSCVARLAGAAQHSHKRAWSGQGSGWQVVPVPDRTPFSRRFGEKVVAPDHRLLATKYDSVWQM